MADFEKYAQKHSMSSSTVFELFRCFFDLILAKIGKNG